MVVGNKRSRTYRRVHKRVPSSKSVLTFQRRKPSKHKCGDCGAVLSGVPHELDVKMRTLPKTQKRPSRPFGGNLCSRCSRKEIIARARGVA